jgi:predicted RNA-binding Zn-ribbon protein involved in translation (DUF1610 family)
MSALFTGLEDRTLSKSSVIQKGPKLFRFGVYFFAALLTLLLIWLGLFVLEDIDRIEAPKISNKDLLAKRDQLNVTLDETARAIQVEEETLNHLRQSTDATQQTLNQLLDVWRRSLDRDRTLTPDERAVFARSQELFLTNQEQVQEVLNRIQELKTKQRETEQARQEIFEQIADLERPLHEQQRRRLAMFKLAFLLPLSLVGGWLFRRMRGRNYAPLMYAANVAIFYLLIVVIHEHFPRAYYKYIFLTVAIVAVLAVLVFLIRQFTRPSASWLLTRYREAYHAAKCPVCQYAIVGQNMRSVVGHKPRRGAATESAQGTTSEYTCPGCGTRLFEKCGSCQNLRHSLLPHCIHCGAEKPSS